MLLMCVGITFIVPESSDTTTLHERTKHTKCGVLVRYRLQAIGLMVVIPLNWTVFLKKEISKYPESILISKVFN